jgi:hypothetical protein
VGELTAELAKSLFTTMTAIEEPVAATAAPAPEAGVEDKAPEAERKPPREDLSNEPIDESLLIIVGSRAGAEHRPRSLQSWPGVNSCCCRPLADRPPPWASNPLGSQVKGKARRPTRPDDVERNAQVQLLQDEIVKLINR